MAHLRQADDELTAQLRQARDESETWRRQAEDGRVATAELRAQAEMLEQALAREREIAAREAARGERLEIALERAQARADRIEAELGELRRHRRPWWRKLLG